MALTPEAEALLSELGIDVNQVPPDQVLAALDLFLRLSPGGQRSILWLAQNATDAELDAAIPQIERAALRAFFQIHRPRIV